MKSLIAATSRIVAFIVLLGLTQAWADKGMPADGEARILASNLGLSVAVGRYTVVPQTAQMTSFVLRSTFVSCGPTTGEFTSYTYLMTPTGITLFLHGEERNNWIRIRGDENSVPGLYYETGIDDNGDSYFFVLNAKANGQFHVIGKCGGGA